MGWGSWLLALAAPIAWKIIASLGVAVFVYVGVDSMIEQMIGYAQSAWSGLPGTVAQFMALGGLNTSLSVICGGISARVTMMMFKRWGIK